MAKTIHPANSSASQGLKHVIEITNLGPKRCAGERPQPVAGSGEVLIRVRASGINRPDVCSARALCPPPGASRCARAGSGRGGRGWRRRRHGKPVCTWGPCLRPGGGRWVRRMVRGAGGAMPSHPCGAGDIEAASLPETFSPSGAMCLTGASAAWRNPAGARRRSGIGVTAIQLGRAFGATVIVTAGSDESAQPAWHWVPTMPSTTNARTLCRGATHHGGRAWMWCWTWWPVATWRRGGMPCRRRASGHHCVQGGPGGKSTPGWYCANA